jgi:hypothetical protein
MADDAGFAVALTIRERVFNDALLIAYAGGDFPRSLETQLADGPPAAGIAVFLSPPKISCNADDTLTIGVQMWGSLTVALDGGETGDVAAHLTLRIRPSFVVVGSDLVLEFDDVKHDVAATEWDFEAISGSSFSPDAETYLRSDFFRDRLQDAMQSAIAFGAVRLPKIDISFLGPLLAAVDDMTAKAHVVEGALVLGLDIDSDEVTTTGDIGELADFARGNDIAAVTNPAAVPVLLRTVQSVVGEQVAQNGATLEQLTLTAQTGRFHVECRASKSTGTASLSFDLIPTMFATKPGGAFEYVPKPVLIHGRTWPALGFTTANIEVDVDPAVWLDILMAAFTATFNLWFTFLVLDLIGSTAASLNAAIASADTGASIPRVQHLKPSVPGGATVRVELAEYEISTAGTYIGITVRPQAPAGALIGLTSIPSDLRAETLAYSVRLPIGVMADDPALRIRWTVIDISGTVLVNEDDLAANRETFTIVPEDVAADSSALDIGCRVYRTLGASITDFFNDGIVLEIRGPLPAEAYVRWRYDVKNPQVEFDEQSQAWAYAGEAVRKRHSNLHRLDRPCANASKRSRYRYETDVLDTLPFPIAELAAHRSELCDYCFYGGPGGIRPAL